MSMTKPCHISAIGHDISFDLIKKTDQAEKEDTAENTSFGQARTDHIFICDFIKDKGGWQKPIIKAYEPFKLFPDALVFHYGQEIFEGLKAYRQTNGQDIALFRPEVNADRFSRSATRLDMEPVPQELFLKGIEELIKIEKDFVPKSPASLYIRPCLIPLDEGVTYQAADNYRFFVILSPVKEYFKVAKPLCAYVEREMARAFPGGLGNTKAGANYAAALMAQNRATKKGAHQVIWLDAIEHKYVEETGAMNIFFVYGNKLVTPALTGTILPGVTRDSILKLANHLGLGTEEKRIAIADVIADAKSGSLTEIFGCGTATVVSPIGSLLTDDEHIKISNGEMGETSKKIKRALLDVQFGRSEDTFDWRRLI